MTTLVTTAHTTTHRTTHGPRSRRPALLARLRQARALMHQRRALSRLDAHRLADLGLSPEDALREANRPFWDAPAHWQKRW